MKRSRIVIVAAAVAVGVSLARPAKAQWVVSDPTNLIQTTATAASTAKTVVWTYQQVKQMQSQIDNQLQTLKSIDPRSFNSLMALIDQGKLTYAMIRSDVDTLGFSVKEINQGFDGLFPRDKSKWKKVRYSDYDNYYTRWNTEITASSKAAERAQANLVIVERNNQQIADILRQAQSANGEVRQLQLINQQLGLIHQELGTLVQNLATAGRVNANMAASAASEKMLQREAAQRRRDGYTSLGRPAQALKRLP